MTQEKNKSENTDEGVDEYSFFHEKEIAKYSVSKDDWVVPENKKEKRFLSCMYVFLAAFVYAVGFQQHR